MIRRAAKKWFFTPEEMELMPHWYERNMSSCVREMQHLSKCGRIRSLIEIRDARLPCIGHPSLSRLQHAPYDVSRLFAYTHTELFDSVQLSRITEYGLRVTGRKPLLLNLGDLKSIKAKAKRKLRDSLSEFIIETQPDSPTPHRCFVAGLPNVGKSSLVLLATKEATQEVRKKKTVHLPKVANVPGHTVVLKTHWMVNQMSRHTQIQLVDTPGLSLPPPLTSDDFLAVSLLGCIPPNYYASKLNYVIGYMLERLNRAESPDYVKYYGLDGPTDDPEVIIKAKRLQQKDKKKDAGALKSKPMSILVLNDFRKHAYGCGVVLDDTQLCPAPSPVPVAKRPQPMTSNAGPNVPNIASIPF